MAKENYAADNIDFKEGSAEDIQESGCDVVYCNHVMHWILDKKSLFHTISRILNQGGRFSFCCDLYDKEAPISPAEGYSDELYTAAKTHYSAATLEELKEMAASNGFDIEHIVQGYNEFKLRDVDHLLEYVIMHSFGKFDRSHFNIPVLEEYHSQRNFVLTYPIVSAVLIKK